ncbi:hypothetical protein BDZ94DRAFT_1260615 [Collybia nuda]|uniref:Novel STAND NTPase 1 domain-containing protein n=1 Tax=Collybia nuda TaxID=64659 RepID=A0A9P5Y5R4_9AGAR|nr:hypothetical protein BDZ94DRAFT_1260615 [Collybia nuda]
MGRIARRPKAPPSGAVIFYGQSTSYDKSKLPGTRIKQPVSSTSSSFEDDPGSPTSSIPSLDTSASLFSDRDFDKESSETSIASSKSGSKSTKSNFKLYTPAPRTSAVTVIALMKTTMTAIQDVPHVGVLAGFVRQIMQITDEVRINKERNLELIDKVVSYACVVFEALQSSQVSSGDGLGELKEDLTRIAEILGNIYKILQSSTENSFIARMDRVIHREDTLSRIQEQDRRLDTAITSFQLKSSIVLRTANTNTTMVKMEPIPPSIRTRHSKKLRALPQIMFGRDGEIENLVTTILQTERPRLAILGPGGIGKTSLALSVLHDTRIHSHFGDDRLFVSCEATTCVDHIILDMALTLNIPPDSISGQLLDAVLDRLRKSPFLVVLDNFETPWELSGVRQDVEMLLQDLSELATVTVLITMRGSQHPAGVEWTHLLPPLHPIDLASATAIFQTISKKADEYATALIEAVDRVPLAVTLLANLAAVDGETTEMLLRRWREENVAMVENGDDRLTSLDCSVRLSLSSPRMRRDPGALPFLRLLALLPDGMSDETFNSFSDGLPGISSVRKALSTLRQNALVFVDAQGSIRVLSPIRLYICAQQPPSVEARRFLQDYFLDLAFQGTSHDNLVVKKRLCAEAENIEAVLVDSLEMGRPLDVVVEAILTFCHHTYVNGVASTGGLCLAVGMFEKLSVSAPNVRNTPALKQPRRTPRLLRFFWKDTAPRQVTDLKPCKANPHLKLHADCLGCWGQILTRRSRFAEAEVKFLLAAKLHIQAGDTAGHAYDLHNLGCLLSRKSETFGEAQEALQEAMKLHEQIGDKIGSAYDLMGLGQVHLQQSQLVQASVAFTDALKLFTECDDDLGTASALNSLGQATLCSSRFGESEDHFSRSLELNVKAGNVIGEAESLAGLAYSLLLRSQFVKAQLRIEEALAIRTPAEDPDHLHILGRVLIAQHKFEQAEQVICRAQVLHDKADDELGSADDKQFLCHIITYNGSLKRAARELMALHDIYRGCDNMLGRADVLAAWGMVLIRRSKLDLASEHLETALKLHGEVGSVLGQAFDLHQMGCLHLRRGQVDEAITSLQEALALHIEVENVQGQADDLNQLAEASLRRQCYDEALTGVCRALALHIQIGDVSGQGDDLYIQACVFLEQSRLPQAEETIHKALKLHIQSGIIYGQARDLATLSSVFWQKYKRDEEGRCEVEAIETLYRAIGLFSGVWALGERDLCYRMVREMESEVEYYPK